MLSVAINDGIGDAAALASYFSSGNFACKNARKIPREPQRGLGVRASCTHEFSSPEEFARKRLCTGFLFHIGYVIHLGRAFDIDVVLAVLGLFRDCRFSRDKESLQFAKAKSALHSCQ